jgi:hypothetical protein
MEGEKKRQRKKEKDCVCERERERERKREKEREITGMKLIDAGTSSIALSSLCQQHLRPMLQNILPWQFTVIPWQYHNSVLQRYINSVITGMAVNYHGICVTNVIKHILT